MRAALGFSGELSVQRIREVHEALITRGGQDGQDAGLSFGGCLRDEQVWVGGTAYSPHGALFVPPCADRVPGCLDDLVAFVNGSNMPSIAKAAVVHAQFETIHPFIDGNGRTGRVLLHAVLRSSDVLRHASLPISAGLLHNIDAYMDAIVQFQAGNPLAIVEQLVDALELAVAVGNMVARDIDEVFAEWADCIHERKGSALHRLPNLLAKQPVVNASFVATELGISTRTAATIIGKGVRNGDAQPHGKPPSRGVLPMRRAYSRARGRVLHAGNPPRSSREVGQAAAERLPQGAKLVRQPAASRPPQPATRRQPPGPRGLALPHAILC